ncbi:MAG: Ig-like domain-containing protein [Muribaculum sp.]|nr:Ig-like domain-containing protein [Muribaculum sp.]
MRVSEDIRYVALCAIFCTLMFGCASIGNPSGGARDEDPPRFVSASPAPGSVNVDSTDLNISIAFDELVNVKNAFEKVVLSPPGKSVPRVTTRGRRILINNTDTLLPNTTYTIDFGDAIEDNNEGNILSGFSYTFSTGSVLDSLRISGMVLGAEDMEPQQGVFVGAYTSDADSAFLKTPFERLARTDEMGRFVLRGLRDTTYRLFALKDLDNDKHYANPEEDIAWFADTIRPTSERIVTQDTIRDLYTGAVDTIVERRRTRFLPNNVLLRMFNTGVKPQYLVSYTRPDSTKLSFIFNSPGERRPIVRLADDEEFPDPLVAEASIGNDSLTFFLPREIAMRDTLKLAIEYVNTDVATGTPRMVNDTVKLTKPKVEKKKEKQKKKKKNKAKKTEVGEDSDDVNEDASEDNEEEEETPPLPTFKFQASGPERDISQPIVLEVPVPLASLDTLGFRLEVKAEGDTVWGNVKNGYRLQRRDTLSERRFKIEYPWQRGMSYRLSADSLVATDIYGVQSDKLQFEFKTKTDDDVSNLKFTLNGLDREIPAFVQIMAGGDKVSYTAKVEDGVANFRGIDSGKYYARVYEDFDGDGKYTPGSYRLQRVYGTPKNELADTLTLRGDSVLVADTLALRVDSVLVADTLALRGDSVVIQKDSVAAVERRPLTDKSMVENLVRMGYSLEPIEGDSIGTDILIAIPPDLVYYYPKTINVKKAWDIEQTWNVFETALDLQKPSKIKKNKPKRKNNDQSQQQEDEEEDEDDMFGNPFNPNDRNNRNNRNQTGGLRRSY